MDFWNRRKSGWFEQRLVTRFAQISDVSLNSARPYSTRQLRHNAFILYRVERVELVYIHEFHSKFPSPQRPHTCVAFAPTLLPGFVSCHRFRFPRLCEFYNFEKILRASFVIRSRRLKLLSNATEGSLTRHLKLSAVDLPRSLNILLEIIYESCKDQEQVEESCNRWWGRFSPEFPAKILNLRVLNGKLTSFRTA